MTQIAIDESIWRTSGIDPDYEANQAKRVAWFNKIAPRGNWKTEIDAWINEWDFANCNEAAIFFTGSPLVIVSNTTPAGKVRVQAEGYYKVIGA
jgi:hypothetical protein